MMRVPVKMSLRFLAIALSVVLLPFTSFAKTTDNGTVVYVSDNANTFDPGGATYARIICLKNSGSENGTLLCTYDQLKNVTVTTSDGNQISKQVYPIYKSTDGGDSWSLISNVFDQEYDLPKTSQPCLFELPQQVGNMPAGTILLAGNIFDDNPKSISRIVIYKSEDHGNTWSFLSQVDQGGPCTYDPSTTSTTTTVWEPFLGLDAYGRLVCYYSDERQKANGILQAVSFKTSTDGVNWGNFGNVAAITNQKDRPGMITVTKLPNGKFLATYEVVNRPSLSKNNAIVYSKFSDDGVSWNANSLGTRVALANGRGIGSSPYVKWVNAGGPNGMVIISAKWGSDSTDSISGGQDFYVNYNLGQGTWERYPMAVTYDPDDTHGGYFSGFSQSFDVSVDGKTIYQATNVENFSNRKRLEGRYYNLNDIRVGSLESNGMIYEAEKANLTNTVIGNNVDASNGQEVQYINYADSKVAFTNVWVPASGTYKINIRYSNGENTTSSHNVKVNGGSNSTVYYPKTADWDRYQWATINVQLNQGTNTVEFTRNSGYAELDCIQVVNDTNAFVLKNRTSGKYLEVMSARTNNGAAVGQWGSTNHLCQKWIFESAGSNSYRIKNVNSGMYLTIDGDSTADGGKAVQKPYSSSQSQLWSLSETNNGYFNVINVKSGKLLEVFNNSSSDGATVGQWGPTGYGCQEWSLVKEGTN